MSARTLHRRLEQEGTISSSAHGGSSRTCSAPLDRTPSGHR
jgi:hypothetical protein